MRQQWDMFTPSTVKDNKSGRGVFSSFPQVGIPLLCTSFYYPVTSGKPLSITSSGAGPVFGNS